MSKLFFKIISVKFVLIIFFVFLQKIFGQYDINILKAAYIERITRFIEWPVNGRDTTIFRIGVYGNNDVLESLTSTLKKKLIKGKQVEVTKLREFSNIKDFDLCYLEGIKKSLIPNIIGEANNYGVLIFTHDEGYGIMGVHINFYIEENKLKFELNFKSLSKGNFKLSYVLTNISKVI